MRGKVHDTADKAKELGITPAYAGKSAVLASRFFRVWDHPRLCGEKGTLGIFIPGNLGSPPPMRGKGIFDHAGIITIGITPAYAGKSRPL